MKTDPRRVLLAVAAAAPVALVTLAIVVFSILDRAGATPSSYGPPRNIAEAAASANASEVMRLLRGGDDPTRIETVRPEIISPEVTRVSAVEGAIWSRHAQIVELLDRAGAMKDAASRHHLACLATDIRSSEIVDYFARRDGPAECVTGQETRAVMARRAGE